MQALSLPVSAGWYWVRAGYALFASQPMPWFTWAMCISLFLMLASFTPPIGPIFFVGLMPTVTVMTLSAARFAESGQKLVPAMWTHPLKRPGVFKRLTGIGALYVGLSLVAGLIAFVPFLSELTAAMEAVVAADGNAVAEVTLLLDAMRTPLIIFAVLYVLVATLFWFTPPLVALNDVPLRQALFFSILACWRNKWAFAIYGIVWGGVFLAIDLLGTLLAGIGLSSQLVGMLQVPLNIILGAVLYCSFYANYTTVFGIERAQAQDPL